MFWPHTVILSKKENYSIQTEQTCPSSLFILRRHYRHIFTAIYRFHKINSSRHNNIWLLQLGITMLMYNKDDIEFVTEFLCFLGHPVYGKYTVFLNIWLVHILSTWIVDAFYKCTFSTWEVHIFYSCSLIIDSTCTLSTYG